MLQNLIKDSQLSGPNGQNVQGIAVPEGHRGDSGSALKVIIIFMSYASDI